MIEDTSTAACGVGGCDAAAGLRNNHIRASMPTLRNLDLTIVSDAICPWCYVAKRRLEKALALIGPTFLVRVTWKPYELNRHMPREGMDRRIYRSGKFGSWERSQRLDAEVSTVGAQDGLSFHHERMMRTPNTFDAHRLIWLAGKEDVQDAVVEALFQAYFTDGRDIGDRSVLADIAGETGLDADRVRAFLDSDDGAAEVSGEEMKAHRLGVSGVPAFIVDGRELFTGAQRTELIAAQLRRAAGIHAAA